MKPVLPFAALVLLGLSACAPLPPAKPRPLHLDIDVSSLAGNPAALAGGHAVGLGVPAGDEPLVDQRFMSLFREQLVLKGQRADDAQPQWLLQASHSLSPLQETLPDKKEHQEVWQDGTYKTVTRWRNGKQYVDQVSTPGRWISQERVIHGGERRVYDLKVALRVYAAPLSPSALPLWEGTLLTRQPQADAQHWAPALMRELAREFPQPSGVPAHRNVQVER